MFQQQATRPSDLSTDTDNDLKRDSGKIKDAIKVVDPSVPTKKEEVSLESANLTKTKVDGVSITEKAEIVKGAVYSELMRRGLSEELAVGYAQLAAVYAVAEEGRTEDRYSAKNPQKKAGQEGSDPVTADMDQEAEPNQELEALEKQEYAEKLEALGIDQEVIEKIELARESELENLESELCEANPEMNELEVSAALQREALEGVSLEAAIQYASTVNEYVEALPAEEQHELVAAASEDVQTLVNDYKENTEEKLLERPVNLESGVQQFSQEELLDIGRKIEQEAEYIQTEMPEIKPEVERGREIDLRQSNNTEIDRAIDLDQEPDSRQDLLDAMAMGFEDAPESELFEQEFNLASAEDYQKIINPGNPFARMRAGGKAA